MTAETPGDPMVKHLVAGGYVLMPNEAINDERLSFRARGVLLYLLGRPPGWVFNAARIAAHGKEGRDAVGAAMRELTDAGYYRWRRIQTPQGFRMKTEVAALPSLMPPLPDASPGSGSSGSGSGSGKSGSGRPASGPPSSVVSIDTTTTENQIPPLPSVASPPLGDGPKRSSGGPGSRGGKHRLPDGWAPTEALLAYAAEKCPLVDVAEETETFRLHFTGTGAQHSNWNASWQRWMRTQQQRMSGRSRKISNRHIDQHTDDAATAERRAAWGETA